MLDMTQPFKGFASQIARDSGESYFGCNSSIM
jgi:hypothetical protein